MQAEEDKAEMSKSYREKVTATKTIKPRLSRRVAVP
ncbi:hypothetical protein CCACVL1_20672 [Corchorus capsularis]|uniref:Uncharacterized protein n=1 Tax=Corchorus capsularis TaxID=210143 RepID=A0A1R3HA69_COCAP|nr:hypothetical protein CCACVL1_20672 [Corchorus capsularis]